MSGALDTIRGDLRRESRSRMVRVALILAIDFGVVAAFLFGPHGSPPPLALYMYGTLSLALGGVWAALALWPALALPGWLGAGLILAAIGSPLLEALLIGGPDPAVWQWRCGRAILMVGAGALLLGRLLLGRLARRFGGARSAFLGIGLMIGAAATGVSCPLTGVLHLLISHTLPLFGIALAAVLAVWLLGEPFGRARSPGVLEKSELR